MNSLPEPRLVVTADGSHSLYNAAVNQHYHSMEGALLESVHIFMNLGLLPVLSQASRRIHVFEMGFGSGLNALLAWQQADLLQRPVLYTGVEAYPVPLDDALQLNYDSITGKAGTRQLHEAPWAETVQLSDYFSFRKEAITLQQFTTDETFDVIFFDAFSPSAQPELWTEEVFRQIASITSEGGVLVTYSSKGSVRRALAAAGFEVKKFPGPGRKLEVVRAQKKAIG